MVQISICHRKSLCVDCSYDKCTRHGDPGADCPKYRCDNPSNDCETCQFIKEYQKEMRKLNDTEKKGTKNDRNTEKSS